MPNPHRNVFAGAIYASAALLDSVKGPQSGIFYALRPTNEGGAEHMAKTGSRVKITLRCSECKQRTYNTMKNKKNDPDRLEMNKYCPFCRKHTVHNETK